MKIFTCEQIRQIDSYTIKHEPVAPIDLMERAAAKLFGWITGEFGRTSRFLIFTGPGNNGGDGLALSRMLLEKDYNVEVYHVRFTGKVSGDWDNNRRRLENQGNQVLKYIEDVSGMPDIRSDDIIIDAIFGSGLSRPASGLAREVISKLNQSDAVRISVDVPSGLFCEDNSTNDPEAIIRADVTLTFQFPKLSFMFPENHRYTGSWKALPIGLHPDAINKSVSPFNIITDSDVIHLLKERRKFDHKGNYGHGLLIAGSYGKIGAAILGSGAALRTGIGLLSCHVPQCGYDILQTAVPEAMIHADSAAEVLTDNINTDPFTAVAIGPGIGTEQETQDAMLKIIEGCSRPMVIDADGLNILALHHDWLNKIPSGAILTPHPREFERLAGKSADSYDRLRKQMEFSQKHKCVVILKGAHTSVSLPDESVWFNTTGNPGMATAGSGDALTGMLLSLLSQGYSPRDAAICGVYLHGTAGDLAAADGSFESLIASDIIKNIGKAFKKIRGH